jgi:acyl-CoA synthetase (NDP forming)
MAAEQTSRTPLTSGDMPADAPAATRDLGALFDPRSIAVVGASSDASKWGGDMAARLARNEKRRAVYFVNRKGGTICDRSAYLSLRELPEAPEMVMLAVPAAVFEATLDKALAVGAKVLVAIFAGLGEADDEGRQREERAVKRIRQAGAMMIGPNCMGVADTGAAFQGVAYLDIPAGNSASSPRVAPWGRSSRCTPGTSASASHGM